MPGRRGNKIKTNRVDARRMLKKSASVRGRLRLRLMMCEARLETGSIFRFHSLSTFSLEPPASNITSPLNLSLPGL
jgi:hypothetical protein